MTNDHDDRSKRFISHLIVVAVGLALLGGGYAAYRFWWKTDESSGFRSQPAVTVTATRAAVETWSDQLSAVGTVTPIRGTMLTSGLAGKVREIHFESGQRVEKGDLLVSLDTSSEEADLESLEPQLRQARSDQERAKQLLSGNAISEEGYEEAFAEVDRLEASIASQKAVIEKKRIVAPFTGKLGIRQVDLGEYISPGTPVTSLQQLAPIFIDFPLPERDAGKVAVGHAVRATSAAYPDKIFNGKITSISPRFDVATRSFDVRAKFPNSSQSLRPGMFADIIVELPTQRTVVVVPQTAIAFNAYGSSVFLLESADDSELPIARRKFVETGQRRGLDIEVVDGVEAGKRVVTAGQMKLADRTKVNVVDSEATSDVPTEPRKP